MLEILSAKGNFAKKYKLKKGDKITHFDGFEAEDDTLDYIFYDSKDKFSMRVLGADGTIRDIDVEKPEDESMNLVFKREDKIRTCHNHCIFCFVDQMGKGMRDSLYVKDDDYTMSFMCGNFVTLTNVFEKDLERIIRLHLSPLYVSVHTMNEKLRCELMGNRFAGKIVDQLKRLTDAKITVHCQAVIVPDKNDGAELEYTARKLFEMYPYVADVAVVPTGITKYRENLTYIPDITPESAKSVLEICDRLNEEFGVNFILPADEYFIRSGKEFKSANFYGDFSQIENGIGMTSKFLSEFNDSIYPTELKTERRIGVICGVSAKGVIDGLCDRANKSVKNLKAFSIPVVNKFFGETVTCTGLLTGGDILEALEKQKENFDIAIIPANTMKEFEDVFLDNMTLKELKAKLKGKKIIVNRSSDEFFSNLIKG
jgi:putative radical SAM enzyme (TIGR03279 family)